MVFTSSQCDLFFDSHIFFKITTVAGGLKVGESLKEGWGYDPKTAWVVDPSRAASSASDDAKSRDTPHLFSTRSLFCCLMIAIQSANRASALGAANTFAP